MSNHIENNEVIEYPYVNFKVKGENFCVSSKYVLQLIISKEFTPIPQTPKFVRGLLNTRNSNFPVVDIRVLYNLNSVETELIELHKVREKHLEWVTELERCVRENVEFTLSKDHHTCSFGIWYDNYKNSDINDILLQIDAPHQELHKQAIQIEAFRLENNALAINSALNKALDLCHKTILPLFDQLIKKYKNQNKGMVILLSDNKNNIGLLVDDIDNIDRFENGRTEKTSMINYKKSYIKNTIVSEQGKIYFELSVNDLFNLTNDAVKDAKI